MALLMFEGFDNWLVSNSSTLYQGFLGSTGLGFWSIGSGGSFSTPAGTLGGKALSVTNGATAQFNTGAANTNTSILGCRFQINGATAGSNRDIIVWYDSAGAVQCGISLSLATIPPIKLIFWRGTNATVLGTGTTTLTVGSDYYLEAKVPLGNSVNVEIRLGGVTEISLTGVDTTNTANQNWQTVGFTATLGIGTPVVYFDDVYLCDSSGSAPYNDFLGGAGSAFTGIRVETLFPTSNNSVTWTPNASTNVSRVQETATDSDTTYNSTATSGNIDTFNHGNLTSVPAAIFSVKVQTLARKEDVPTQSVRTKLISGATTSNGTSHPVTTTYQTLEDYFNNDPNTGVAWSGATPVNATKIGYENTS